MFAALGVFFAIQRYKQNRQQTPLTIYAPVHRKASGHLLAFAPVHSGYFFEKDFVWSAVNESGFSIARTFWTRSLLSSSRSNPPITACSASMLWGGA